MQKNVTNITTFVAQNIAQTKTRNEIKFTDIAIKNLKPKGKRITYWCQGMDGFGIRVSVKGTKTWVYMFRIGGNPHPIRMTLGRYPKISLHAARQSFFEANDKVKRDINPKEEKKELERKEAETLTVNALFDRYMDFCKKRGESRWQEKSRALKKEILPFIGNKKIHDVSFREIAKIINDMFINRGTAVQAARVLSHTRCMFKYAKNNLALIEINPCSDLEAPRKSKKPKHALEPKDIYLFWTKIGETRMTNVVQLALKFMLCTLARGVEVREMRWAEVNLKDKVWIIPSENAKNRREHLVPLNRHALAILSEVWEITGHSDYVFGYNPAMNSDSLKKYHELKPMGVTALSHAMRDNFHMFGIEKKFTPHNLRRTGATRLTSSGYSKEWVKKLLNHADQDVTDIYDVYDYFEEKRAGTELIGYLLDRILSNEEPIQVPSVKTLRREVLTKGLVYKFMSDEYYEKETNANIPMGFQATFSSPVSYMLSCAHDELKKSA